MGCYQNINSMSCKIRGMRLQHHLSNNMTHNRGVALVLVLWIVVLLSVIGVSHSRNVRIDMQIARHHIDNASVKAMAEAGVNRAIIELFNKDDATRWPYNGEIQIMDYDGGVVQIMIRNTAGLVDLNTASSPLLEALFSVTDIETTKRAELVDAIMDWRDSDDLKRLHGAEDAEYKMERLDYGTPDRRFYSIGELRYVLGMNTNIYNAISPFITVYSGSNTVNKNFAPIELASLFTNSSDQAINDVSISIDEEEDDRQGSQRPALQGNMSKVFHISVWATAQGGASAGLEVDVDTTRKGNNHFSIISWQESSQG